MTKRLLDLAGAVFGLVLLSPVLAAIALLIKVGSPGPVFYRGVRVGRHGRPFCILKFRTMVVDAEKVGASSTPDTDPRITRVGRFLRSHKLDELPQLLNVAKGEMSLVGPRPQVQWDVDNYTSEERELLSVRPGITDLASLRFHNEGEILQGHADPDAAYVALIRPEKIRLGLQYVRTHSLRMDLLILLRTLLVALGRRPEAGAAEGEPKIP